MFTIDWIILLTGVIVLLGIASSKISNRLGLPVLVLFLALGMLAGSEGIGGIDFENYEIAHAIGTLALAMILFDGGLGTPLAAIRDVWKPALAMAVPGVFLTAIVTGLAASWILGIPLAEGMLLGSIVGSTDAAAVFSVLRAGGVTIAKRLQSLLEVESASNDPMAIFMTIACIEIVTSEEPMGIGLLSLFASQMMVGAVVGLAMGYATVRVVNWIKLDAAGLYPALVTGFGLFTFGLTVLLGGSGFLAVYLAGVVIGNNRIVFQRGIRVFHDAGAWLSQIVMFVVLGLLSFPSRLLGVAPWGLLIGAVLIFVARPLATYSLLLPFRTFNRRELVFIAWVGLKGAVPVTLATFPLLYNTPHAEVTFDVVFFVVVLSAVVQGGSLPTVARWLDLEAPSSDVPPITLELSSLQNVDADIVDYAVMVGSRAAGRCVKDLALPEGVIIALVSRDDNIIPPQGSTRLEEGDHVIVITKPSNRALVDHIFGASIIAPSSVLGEVEFPLRGTTTVELVKDMYGLDLGADPHATLDQALRAQFGQEIAEGAELPCGIMSLKVRKLSEDGRVEQVGIVFDVPDRGDPPQPV